MVLNSENPVEPLAEPTRQRRDLVEATRRAVVDPAPDLVPSVPGLGGQETGQVRIGHRTGGGPRR